MEFGPKKSGAPERPSEAFDLRLNRPDIVLCVSSIKKSIPLCFVGRVANLFMQSR